MIEYKCQECDVVMIKISEPNFLGESIYKCPNEHCPYIDKHEAVFGYKQINTRMFEVDQKMENKKELNHKFTLPDNKDDYANTRIVKKKDQFKKDIPGKNMEGERDCKKDHYEITVRYLESIVDNLQKTIDNYNIKIKKLEECLKR